MNRVMAVLLLFPLATACATTTQHNLSASMLEIDPTIRAYSDPSSTGLLADQLTFSVVPASALFEENQLTGLIEKQMLFQLRNCFEVQGYEFVSLSGNPDFIVTVDGDCPYRESYVPSRTVSVPTFVPGRLITTNSLSGGTFSFQTLGSDVSGWGTYTGSATSSTYVPGHVGTRSYTSPGYVSGRYFPGLSVWVLDADSLTTVWSAIGVGTSRNGDLRVSGQVLLNQMIGKFPRRVTPPKRIQVHNGRIGVGIAILTNDGNTYFPTVIGVEEKSPAKKGGVQLFDMITEVDGRQTANMSAAEFFDLLAGDEGEAVSLKLWRMGTEKRVEIVRQHRMKR